MERARRIGYDIFVEERKQAAGSETVLVYRPSTTVHQPDLSPHLRQVAHRVPARADDRQPGGQGHGARLGRVQKEADHLHRHARAARDPGVGQRGGQDAIDKSDRTEGRDRRDQAGGERRPRRRSSRRRSSKASPRTWSRPPARSPALPDIRAGTVLEIDGLGERFSGRYFVVSTTHTIGDSGYTTQFECRREEL